MTDWNAAIDAAAAMIDGEAGRCKRDCEATTARQMEMVPGDDNHQAMSEQFACQAARLAMCRDLAAKVRALKK